AVTTTVCTLVGNGGGSATAFSGSGTNGCGRGARGAEAAKRGAGLAPGRCGFDGSCERSACEPRYGRAPLGRSPAGRRGLLTRRLMILGLQTSPLGSAKAADRHRFIA